MNFKCGRVRNRSENSTSIWEKLKRCGRNLRLDTSIFFIGVYHFFNGHKIYWPIRCERTPKIFFVECFTVETSLILLVYLDFLQHLTRISEYLFYRKK